MAKHFKKKDTQEDIFEYASFGIKTDDEQIDTSLQGDAFSDVSPENEPKATESPKENKAVFKEEKRRQKEEALIRKYEEELARKGRGKKRTFKDILKILLPWKGDDAMELTRKSILLIAIAAFIVSASILGNFAWASMKNQQTNEEIKKLYKNPNYDLTGVDFPEGANETDFAALYIENSDTIGWIHIPNTNIDNVVVRGRDNDFYLDHDFYKKSSEHGTVMADFRTSFDVSGNSKNVALYGHHMKDGSMFAQLEKYRTFSFYKANPVVYFDTLYSEGKYEIFSVFITNDLEAEDNGYRFNFNQVNFSTEEEFMEFIKQVRRRSIYNTSVTVSPTDEILTLSTCVYDFNEARLVVCARRLLENEQPADTSTATRNPTPLYPQAWYDKKGGKKPVFNDDETVVLPNSSTVSDSTASISSDPNASSNTGPNLPSIPQGTGSSPATTSSSLTGTTSELKPPVSSTPAGSKPTQSTVPSSKPTASETAPKQ